MKIYTLNGGAPVEWLRADAALGGNDNDATMRSGLCGEWLNVAGTERFFTAKAHDNSAVIRAWLTLTDPLKYTPAVLNTLNFVSVGTNGNSQIRDILSRDGTIVVGNRSQCFLGGASELNVGAAAPYGGTPTSFKNSDGNGTWRAYPGVVDPRVLLARPTEAAYLFPLHRSVNSGMRGVINVTGTVGVSGLLVGRITLHTTGTVVLLDDIRYGTNPAVTGLCADVLGLLSDKDVVVADNMLNNQTDVQIGGGTVMRLMDDTKDFTLHAVVMAISTSFRVEAYNTGQTTGNPCNGNDKGRGCLALLGGLIQDARGPVGLTNGSGFGKQYTYDRCANLRPPPYFPTTGRYLDNRYMEVDPVNFNISTLMSRLQPAP